MNPVAEAIDLPQAMLTAAGQRDWPRFARLQERRLQLFKPGLGSHALLRPAAGAP